MLSSSGEDSNLGFIPSPEGNERVQSHMNKMLATGFAQTPLLNQKVLFCPSSEFPS